MRNARRTQAGPSGTPQGHSVLPQRHNDFTAKAPRTPRNPWAGLGVLLVRVLHEVLSCLGRYVLPAGRRHGLKTREEYGRSRERRLDRPESPRSRLPIARPLLASTRSATSKRRSRETIGKGRSKNRSYSLGRFCRPISRTSPKPCVVTRAVFAHVPSRRALVATVEPCTIRSTCSGMITPRWMRWDNAAMTPSAGFCGVEAVLNE